MSPASPAPRTVSITEREIRDDPQAATMKALAARARGDLLEVPWWFYPHALSNPRTRRGELPRRPSRSGGSSEDEL